MLYLILSIFCSVTVGALFKFIRRHDTSPIQIVGWNYVFALILCYFFFRPNLYSFNFGKHWQLYLPLSLLLPGVFLLLAASVKHMGIVKTDAAQRLSLFIPILAAWLIFGEQFSLLKLAGLGVAFPAILLILASKHDENHNRKWVFPLLVLLGFGVIDVLFKQVALLPSPGYTTSLFFIFCGALMAMIIVIAYDVIIRKLRLQPLNFAFGALVGIFNFGNIIFYLKAHKQFSDNPSTVFAAMNMGVIVLGSFAGIIIFKEKLTWRNYLGIGLALVAILLITLSQLYKPK